MTCIDIDIDDYLDEVSEDALRREVDRRIAAGSWSNSDHAPEPWTRAGLAADIRAAYYARNASRLELLLVILEQREAVA
jgi:hypothetical protein